MLLKIINHLVIFEPIVYAVYSNKNAAQKYADFLIKDRKTRAKERNWEFGSYHVLGEDKRKETDFEKFQEKIVFSTCLKVRNGLEEDFTEDGCWIKVVRRPIMNRFQ